MRKLNKIVKKTIFILAMALFALNVKAQSPITEFEETISYINCNYVQAVFKFTGSNTADYDSLRWDFGNGTIEYNVKRTGYVYSQPGTYTVTLTLWLNGVQTQIVKPDLIKVYNAPVSSFNYTVSDTNRIAPLYIDFQNQSTLGEGDTVVYSWYINGQMISNDTNISYSFENPDSYCVQLIINDNNGCQAYGIEEFIRVKDLIQINEFEYITSDCSTKNSCLADINYRIENNTLKLFGKINKNCCSYKTAVIIDMGDTIKIPTFESGCSFCKCNCLFCFEINIPNFNRDSCVIVFENQNIMVNSKINSVSDFKTDKNIKITPNPFKELIVVEINDISENNYQIEILNVLGELIHKQNILNNSTNINMSKHNKGIYLLRISTGNKIIMTEKLIKE